MLLRPYSTCYNCGLKARLLLLLLLIHTFATACTDNPAEEEADTPVERRTAEPDTTSVSNARAPGTLDLLGNPFVANRQQSNNLTTYFDRINTDFTVDADAVENRHKASITDTIYTIRFGNSALEFYAPTHSGELLLQMADIRGTDIKLRNNLRVGMTQAELLSRLKSGGEDLKITQTPAEIIASAREGAPATLHFYLEKGKVSRILYEGYVD